MNSLQISNILNNYRRLRGIFIGVFASDNIRISPTASYPLCFVANTERQGTAGEHWIACWASSRQRVEYFDSFGDPPPPEIEHKLRAHFPVIEKNKFRMQSLLSDACGPYCIAFLALRLRCGSFNRLMRKFVSLPSRERDHAVKYFVRSMNPMGI
jgi:hypothetical protein